VRDFSCACCPFSDALNGDSLPPLVGRILLFHAGFSNIFLGVNEFAQLQYLVAILKCGKVCSLALGFTGTDDTLLEHVVLCNIVANVVGSLVALVLHKTTQTPAKAARTTLA